jgi:hypothetical protein
MTTLAERDVSQDLPCAYCGKPLWRIHPDLRFVLQWGHVSREDTRNCTRSKSWWPVPSAESVMDRYRRKHYEQLEPWAGKAASSE